MQYEASDDCVAKRATTSEDPPMHDLVSILIPLQPYPPPVDSRPDKYQETVERSKQPSPADSIVNTKMNSGACTFASRKRLEAKIIISAPQACDRIRHLPRYLLPFGYQFGGHGARNERLETCIMADQGKGERSGIVNHQGRRDI